MLSVVQKLCTPATLYSNAEFVCPPMKETNDSFGFRVGQVINTGFPFNNCILTYLLQEFSNLRSLHKPGWEDKTQDMFRQCLFFMKLDHVKGKKK